MDKKNVIILILSTLLAFACFVFVVLLVHKRNNNITLDGKYNVLNLEKCVKSSCDKTFHFLDNDLTVKKSRDKSYEISYNDYAIFASVDYPTIGDAIYTYEDSLLFPVKDREGNLLLMQYQMGNYTAEEVKIGDDDFWYVKSVESKENQMTVEVSRFLNPKTFVDMPNEAFVEISDCDSYKEFQDRDAVAYYVIEYNDGKLSLPELKSIKKLSELKEFSSLCKKK